jgi:hypothetical protein
LKPLEQESRLMNVRPFAFAVAASFASLSLVLAGCGGKEPAPEPAAAATSEPQPDPELEEIHATFEAASQALARGDYTSYSRTLTPQTQERMAGNLAMTGAVLQQQMASTQALSALTEQFGGAEEGEDATANAELERMVEVLKKHGVEDIDPVSLLGGGGQASGPALVAASIEDKPAFIGEMLDAVMAVQAKAGLQSGQQIAPPAPGELTDVKVERDVATGTMKHTINGQERQGLITFRKVGDDWKIDNGDAVQ